MKNNKEHKGSWHISIAYAYVCIILGLGIFSWALHDAEALLGGSGNVTLSNNPHNFAYNSTGVKADTEDRICVFCHTPHGASSDSALVNGPLWNHELSSAIYNNWGSGSLVNTPPYISNVGFVNMLTDQPAQPDGTSRMCMSCHDGTISIGNIVSGSAITMDTADACIDADGSLSTSCIPLTFQDLTTKHVVSVPMNDQLIADSAANCDGSQTTRLSYPWNGVSPQSDNVFLRPTLELYPVSSGSPGVSSGFPNNKYSTNYSYGVQCSTCHDPHKWNSSSGNEGYKFLVTAQTVTLCIACHDPCP